VGEKRKKDDSCANMKPKTNETNEGLANTILFGVWREDRPTTVTFCELGHPRYIYLIWGVDEYKVGAVSLAAHITKGGEL